jgi:hypothetical protein
MINKLKKIADKIITTPYKWLAAAIILFIVSFLFDQFSQKNNIKQEWKKLDTYLAKKVSEFEKLSNDTVLNRKLLSQAESIEEFNGVLDYSFGYYLAKKYKWGNSEIVFWNNQESLPTGDIYNLPDGEYFKKLDNGYYLCIRKSILIDQTDDSTIAIGLIPVQYDYFIETGYLPNRFAYSDKADIRISISTEVTPYPVKSTSGKVLFYLTGKNQTNKTGSAGFVFWLKVIATLMLLIFFHLLQKKILERRGLFMELQHLQFV